MVTLAEIGSLPERMVIRELRRRGLQQDIDFFFQGTLFGGRAVRGGYVPDIVFGPTYPGLAFNIQGVYWHYGQGFEVIARDRLQREQMAGQGITLIFLDEDDVLKDVRYYVGEGLEYKDHSRLST